VNKGGKTAQNKIIFPFCKAQTKNVLFGIFVYFYLIRSANQARANKLFALLHRNS
jgi:hypothetical protein